MTCALCKKEAELQNSHIIPKLVYKRVQSHPRSRFRALDRITQAMQDGEKHYILCHECEETFSALEVYFANRFLDEYLNNDVMPAIDDKIEDYILSVAWRTLWDDMYRLNAYCGKHMRSEFESFERDLNRYLISNDRRNRCIFKNYIWKLSDLIDSKAINEMAQGTLSAYTYYPNVVVGCLVLVYYAGLVFVTQYEQPRKSVLILDGADIETNIKKLIIEELLLRFSEMAAQYQSNMTPELKEKIRLYYRNK